MASFVFIVQGEGRGHLSQAIAMKQILEKDGHEIRTVYVGTSPFRELPRYFTELFAKQLQKFRSPNFIQRSGRKGITIMRSFHYNIIRSFSYRREISKIVSQVNSSHPDFIINFYDLVGALALKRISGGITKIGISHHFYFQHPSFKYPEERYTERMLLEKLNQIMMKHCDIVLALSFRKQKDHGKLKIMPPLIREKFFEISHSPGKRDLVYLIHPGYIKEIISSGKNDPDFKADIFADTFHVSNIPSNFKIHPLDDRLFVEKMAQCRRFITTAGFDSIAEAAFLGIPIVAAPSENHYEQLCNAIDMNGAGFGVWGTRFSMDLIAKAGSYDNGAYKKWVESAESILLKIFEK